MHQKRTKKLFLLTTWRMDLFTKRAFFCSFLNVIFLEKVICTFCLAKCIRKGQKNCSFWLHEEWLSPQKEQLFLFFSERHLSRKKRNLYFLPCQMHQNRTIQIVTFDYMKNSSHHKKNNLFGSFLNVIFLEKKRHLYFLPCQMHQKRTTKIVPFDYMKNGSHHKKSILFCSFLNITFLEKNVICTFCLAKCIRKGQQNCSFWLHEEWLSPQK